MGTSDTWNTAYFRITRRIPKKLGWFEGIVEDPYYGKPVPWYPFPVKNGDQRKFSKYHVIEVPLEWEGNEELKIKARYRPN